MGSGVTTWEGHFEAQTKEREPRDMQGVGRDLPVAQNLASEVSLPGSFTAFPLCGSTALSFKFAKPQSSTLHAHNCARMKAGCCGACV